MGWIKRGPSGVIGTNKRDAQETVDHVLEDLAESRLPEPADADPTSIEALVAERKPDFVSYAGWEAIDAAEKAAGEPQGRPRVKLTRVDEMLDAAGRGCGPGTSALSARSAAAPARTRRPAHPAPARRAPTCR